MSTLVCVITTDQDFYDAVLGSAEKLRLNDRISNFNDPDSGLPDAGFYSIIVDEQTTSLSTVQIAVDLSGGESRVAIVGPCSENMAARVRRCKNRVLYVESMPSLWCLQWWTDILGRR